MLAEIPKHCRHLFHFLAATRGEFKGDELSLKPYSLQELEHVTHMMPLRAEVLAAGYVPLCVEEPAPFAAVGKPDAAWDSRDVRNDRRLQAPLRIDRDFVSLGANFPDKALYFTRDIDPVGGVQKGFSPVVAVASMDVVDVGMSFYGTRQFSVYSPSYLGLRMVTANRGWQRQRLNDIAERTQPYDQYL